MTGPIALPGAPLPLAPQPSARAEPHVPDDIRRAAEEFEAVFLSEMLAPMFEGIDTEGLGGGGMGEEVFRPMLIERYASAITSAGGIGIADSVIRELMRLQSAVPPPEEPGDVAQR